MARDRAGGQDDGGRGAARLRSRWLAPALCLFGVVCAFWLGSILLSQAPRQAEDASVGAARDTAQGALPPGASAPADDPGEVTDAQSGDGDEEELADAIPVDAVTFLDVLNRASSEEARGEVSCTWTVEAPLDELAGDVLRAYRDTPGTELATSGYLDLKGNAWGAIVIGGDGWVDVIVVAAGKDDASATARIVRMTASSAPGQAAEAQ